MASSNVRALAALNELLSVLFFARYLIFYSVAGDSGSAGESQGGMILNCIIEIPLVPKDARFLSLIDRIGKNGTVSSLEFFIPVE
ncbi:MAG: hypothetical protein ACFFCW_22260 [Candidatus Hodarchaeota archaeon]